MPTAAAAAPHPAVRLASAPRAPAHEARSSVTPPPRRSPAKFSNVHTLTLHFQGTFGPSQSEVTFIGLKGDHTEVCTPPPPNSPPPHV